MSSSYILSDNGVSSGSAGLKSSAGNDGVLVLQTANSSGTATNAVYIDNSQQVLLGPTSDLGLGGTGKFQIAGTASTQAWVARYSNDTGGPVYKLFKSRGTTIGSNGLVQNGDTVGSISFDVANGSTYNQTAQILVGVEGVASATSTPSNMIFSTTAAGSIVASESLRLNSVGTVILKGGSTSATGVGITFPATQSASTDANTLDDYAEGTFTPTLSAQSGSLSSASASATYTKIGRQVTLQLNIYIANKGTAAGVLFFTLPFTNGGILGSGVARETDVTGFIWGFYVNASASNGFMLGYTNQDLSSVSNGYRFQGTLVYAASA